MKPNENTPISALERRIGICRMLEENSRVFVPELCEIFDVSPATIRSDLRELEGEGQLRRTHGGAIPIGKAGFEPDAALKEVENIAQKQQIALAAATQVENGDTIALDTGTTTMELARCLVDKKKLTIVTNDLQIASFLELSSEADVIIVGGEVRRGFHCTTGPMAQSGLRHLNVDKAFMAANAFSLEKGFTTPFMAQAEIKRVFLSVASQIIMLADSSKIGRISFVQFADLGSIDKWYVDSGIGKRAALAIREQSETVELCVV